MGRKTVATKKSKNQIRRERLKAAKLQENKSDLKPVTVRKPDENTSTETQKVPLTVESEHDIGSFNDEKLQELYMEIFDKFDASKIKEESEDEEIEKENVENNTEDKATETKHLKDNTITPDTNNQIVTSNIPFNDSTVSNNQISHSNDNLTKRQFKKRYSIPLSVLKSEAKKPEVIEWIDSNSPDPYLHIYLKSQINSVKVPNHWKSKKSFLSSKRGIERPPFELPKFIRDTGILEMRNIAEEADDQSTLKQKMRERVQPKSGQLDIDYNKLYDAFFKYQKKPPLLKFGELYTENTNNEDLILNYQISRLKVGVLSSKLKFALGMINESGKIINKLPPWYSKMKQLGPPPSYPDMDISESGVITVDNSSDVNIGPPIVTSHWGLLTNDLDFSDDESGDEEDEETNGKENSKNKKQEKDNNGFDKTKGDIMLTTFGADPTRNLNANVVKGNDDTKKSLYQVLQSGSTKTDSIFGSNADTYNISK